MNEILFSQIKTEYDNFYRDLLKKGKLPMHSTEKGFWHASIAGEIYGAFRRINLSKFQNFLDLGSGDGKVVLIASLFCKNCEGIEIDKNLHKKAVELKEKFGLKNINFHNKDMLEHDISKYDILFLSPDAPLERGMENKLVKEMKGKLIHYGNHFHPKLLRKEESFLVNGTMVSVYRKLR